MGLRKNRPSPKSIAATKFLREYLASGPVPVSEVQEAAHRRGISPHTLTRLSQGLVTKKPQVGPDGTRQSYWSLCPSPPYVSDTPAAARENSVAFKSGYGQAVADMLLRVNRICDEMNNKTARHASSILRAVLNELKSKSQ